MSKWYKNTLVKIADIRLSNVDKKIIDGEIPVRLCNYMDAYSNDYLNARIKYSQGSVKLAEIDRFGLMCGDVVITKDSETPDDIAVPAVVIDKLDKVICGYHLAILRPKKDILNGIFLMNALKEHSTKQWFIRKANGITRYGLSKTYIENVEINYPDRPYQRKIARILTTVDKVIEQTENTIEKLKKIKQGMMHDLFTRGIDVKTGKLRSSYSEVPQLYKQTDLGWIPKEWDVGNLGAYFSASSGTGLSQSKMKPGIFPVYGGNGINGYHDEYLFKEERLIIGRVGEYCGNVYITKQNSWITDNALIVKFQATNENLKFWSMYLNYIDLRRFAFAAAQPVITGGILERIEFKVIPNNEQRIFVEKLESVKRNLSIESASLIKNNSIKQGLMQDLLTGKVEVTPDPQDKEYQEVG